MWHIPVLASLCVGIPLLIASYFGKPGYGILAGTGGLVILYLPATTIAHRMIYLLSCSFGFMISFTIGISFSFNPIISSIVLGLFSFGIHWISNFFEMRPPGNFFFIMLASIASCLPFTPLTIFLAESGNTLITDPNTLIPTRFLDILYGSLIGALGGFFLHHRQIRHKAERQIRKTRVAILRR